MNPPNPTEIIDIADFTLKLTSPPIGETMVCSNSEKGEIVIVLKKNPRKANVSEISLKLGLILKLEELEVD